MPVFFNATQFIKMPFATKILNGDTSNKHKYAQNNAYTVNVA